MSHKKAKVYGMSAPFVNIGLNAPAVTSATRAPITSDHGTIGDVWVNRTSAISYILTQNVGGTFTWSVSSAGSGDLDTLTGDGGGAITPAAGNITLAGGTNITSAGAGNTITFNLDGAITLATSVTSPLYLAAAGMEIRAAAANDITLQMGDAVGANVIDFEDSASATVASLNSNGQFSAVNLDGIIGAVTPAAITGTTITGSTSITSPIYTTAAGVDTNINSAAGQNIIIQMGDNAGANRVSFEDSDSAEVFSIDSNGALSTLTALTVAGAFTQTAGAVLIGQDNAANAIDIGGGNVARAMTIASGAALHTLAIGSASAGAMSIDTAAGISLDAATASNFTVTGAAADLTLNSSAGSVNITGAEAVADAIVIDASDGAGGVQIQAGTGGVLIGNEADTTTLDLGNFAPTASRTISIGGGTVVTAAVTDTVDVGPDGATTNANSIKTVNINTGGVTLGEVLTNVATGAVTSGTHTTEIATGNRAAGTMALNLMTGTGTKTLSIGNADGLTTTGILGPANINASQNNNTAINSGTSTGTVTIGNGAAGAITVDTAAGISLDAATASNITVSAGALDIDSSGQLQINSSAGTIDIGNDAVAQNMNFGTGAAQRDIIIGNVSGTTSISLNVGTGNFALEGDTTSTYAISNVGVNTGQVDLAGGTGARTINIAGGGTGIKTVNIAAAATADIVTIGTTTGAGSLTLAAGTGEITMSGTVKEITSEFTTRSGDSITFTQSPIVQTSSASGGLPLSGSGNINIISFQDGVFMEQFLIGGGMSLTNPRMDGTGLSCALDQTLGDGVEYNFGAPRTNSRHAFTIGTSAAFFFEVRFSAVDISAGTPFVIGFRKSEANVQAMIDYTDYATIGLNTASSTTEVVLMTELNSGGQTITNTTDLWGGDGAANTLRVLVSAAGVVTYTINGAAPSATAAFTFDNADVICPFIRYVQGADLSLVHLISMKVGFQA